MYNMLGGANEISRHIKYHSDYRSDFFLLYHSTSVLTYIDTWYLDFNVSELL